MRPDDNGAPLVSQDRNCLGARTPANTNNSERVDITPDQNGQVVPNKGGLSVTSVLSNLPAMLMPPEFTEFFTLNEKYRGARGEGLVLYCFEGLEYKSHIMSSDLQLTTSSRTHGTIEPCRSMHIDDYQVALAITQLSWTRSDPDGT